MIWVMVIKGIFTSRTSLDASTLRCFILLQYQNTCPHSSESASNIGFPSWLSFCGLLASIMAACSKLRWCRRASNLLGRGTAKGHRMLRGAWPLPIIYICLPETPVKLLFSIPSIHFKKAILRLFYYGYSFRWFGCAFVSLLNERD